MMRLIKYSFVSIITMIIVLHLASCKENGLGINKNAGLEDKVNELVEGYIANEEFVGTQVLVIENEKNVVSSSFGFSNVKEKELISEDTVFALGSNTKILTSSSILLLQQSQQIELDDKVDKFIDLEALNDSGITIRNLLCHTSGLPDIYNIEEKGSVNQQSLDQFISLLNDLPKISKPLEQFQYNNTGYLLLGKIIEVVSNKSLGDFYREYIFAPLKLQQTYYLGDTFRPQRMSSAYKEDLTVFNQFHQYFSEYRIAQGAGGAGGTLREFGKWHKKLIETGLLSASSIEEKTAPCKLSDGSEAEYSSGHYGLGVKMKNINGIFVYSHGGAINGFVSDIFFSPKLDVTVVFAINTWRNPSKFRDELLDLVFKHYSEDADDRS